MTKILLKYFFVISVFKFVGVLTLYCYTCDFADKCNETTTNGTDHCEEVAATSDLFLSGSIVNRPIDYRCFSAACLYEDVSVIVRGCTAFNLSLRRYFSKKDKDCQLTEICTSDFCNTGGGVKISTLSLPSKILLFCIFAIREFIT